MNIQTHLRPVTDELGMPVKLAHIEIAVNGSFATIEGPGFSVMVGAEQVGNDTVISLQAWDETVTIGHDNPTTEVTLTRHGDGAHQEN